MCTCSAKLSGCLPVIVCELLDELGQPTPQACSYAPGIEGANLERARRAGPYLYAEDVV